MRLWTVVLLGGCGASATAPEADWPVAQQHAEGPEYRGPGQWRPAESVTARPASVFLLTSGLMGEVDGIADHDGRQVQFSRDGQACEVDATTGAMDTDVDVTPDEPGGGNRPTSLADATPTGGMLVIVGGSLVSAATGDGVQVLDAGPVSTARAVGDGYAAIAAGCQVRWDDGATASVPGCTDEIAVDGDRLLVVTDRGVVSVLGGEVDAVANGAFRHIAVDPLSHTLVTATDDRVEGRTGDHVAWSMPSPGKVLDLDDAGDLGLALVYTRDDQNELLHVLDAPTGEELGILELRDQTTAIDVSAQGGLLVQRRGEDVVSWRIVR